MPDPIILSAYDGGKHNADLDSTVSRLERETAWRDLSTIMITPGGKPIPLRVVASWESMALPPNNKFTRMTPLHMEVGEAYSRTIEAILNHPELSKWKYILTREHDNAMPPDGLIKLLQQMEDNKEYAAIGGLYFTKGPGGCAQIWGDPHDMPLNFRPQPPNRDGSLKECCGLGMGFTIFRLEMFKDDRLRKPWFATKNGYSQDLYFWSDAKQHGYRCAVDCSIRVGHYSSEDDTMW